jgi:hypothetical protein
MKKNLLYLCANTRFMTDIDAISIHWTSSKHSVTITVELEDIVSTNRALPISIQTKVGLESSSTFVLNTFTSPSPT